MQLPSSPLVLLLPLLLLSLNAQAGFGLESIKIVLSKDKKTETQIAKTEAPKKVITCHVEAFGKKFFGEGETKGQASRKATEKCQEEYDGMFCDKTKCDND